VCRGTVGSQTRLNKRMKKNPAMSLDHDPSSHRSPAGGELHSAGADASGKFTLFVFPIS
jgi:hypothetical protein